MIAGDGAFDPAAIREIENRWIPVRDGTRLAARLWMPRDADRRPVPAILEYIPYRKRDFMRERDEPMHRYFAHAGYASLRVDLRGSGDSEGVLRDEYDPLEQQDALDIIAWIAAQDWCDGAVGMTGISWGGFNALQVAALRPPALKAIITLCASDDRYADDAHYKGGSLLTENMQWGSILTLYNALPPDPAIVGDRWRQMWDHRLEALRPLPPLWMRHPARDGYWRQGSVCEDFGAIRCAVYAIGGWADGYTNAIPRLMQGLSCPRKALIGPWAHMFPHLGVPGPAIGYLQEAVRWWNHWLKGRATGIMDEPMLRVWMQDTVPPAPQHALRPGRWVSADGWPDPAVAPRTLYLARGRLTAQAPIPSEMSVRSPLTVGACGGEWCGFGADGEAPRDQRPDDGGSLVHDGAPLEAPLDLLGFPVLDLPVRVNAPCGILVARLCDVAPDGTSLRMSYGVLNLSFRDGFAAPAPVPPGEWMTVRLQLDLVGHRVTPGHRLRLALSTGYWPMIWPAPERVTLSVRLGEAALRLPVRHPDASDPPLAPFGPPLAAPGTSYVTLQPRAAVRRQDLDLATGEMVYLSEGDGGEFGGAELARLDEIDLEMSYWQRKEFRIVEDDPLSTRMAFDQRALLRREGWEVALRLDTGLRGTRSTLRFEGRLQAALNGETVVERQWTEDLPRETF